MGVTQYEEDHLSYKDFDLSFYPHPLTGDLIQLKNYEAVKQAVKNVLLSEHRCGLEHGFLFEQSSMLLASELRGNIEFAIKKYEKRAKIQDIITALLPEDDGYVVTVIYKVVSTDHIEKVDHYFYRVR